MKLNVDQLRYLSKDDFRTLQAVELGQKNHEIVPVTLVDSIARLKHGGTVRCLKVLLKAKLVHHENINYDGYRLTYLGYDFLAIKTLVNRGIITSVGRQIGVGKESDIFEVSNENGEVMALKLHRLGRTSFRAVKSKRDYLKHRNSFSWLYLSRLAALKEFAFMKALGQHGFPVPEAIDNNRHAVLMSLIDGYPLVQVRELENPGEVYRTCMDIMCKLAAKGLIHCDFNEFNLLINESEDITLIDFPQMVSSNHANAEDLFYRDVDCVIRFFKKKIAYIPELDASLPYVRPNFQAIIAEKEDDLGPELKASGFENEDTSALEQYSHETDLNSESDEDSATSSHCSDLKTSSDLTTSSEKESNSIENSEGDEDRIAQGVEPLSKLETQGKEGKEMISSEGREDFDSAGFQSLEDNVFDSHSVPRMPLCGIPLDSNLDREGSLTEMPKEDIESLSNAVSNKLVLEKRKAKQIQKIRNAVRSAHKSSDKRTRSRGGVNIDY